MKRQVSKAQCQSRGAIVRNKANWPARAGRAVAGANCAKQSQSANGCPAVEVPHHSSIPPFHRSPSPLGGQLYKQSQLTGVNAMQRLVWTPASPARPGAATKTSYPQISQITADFQRNTTEQEEETTDGDGTTSLLLSSSLLFLESARICVICGISNSFSPGDLRRVPSESLSRKQDLAALQCRVHGCHSSVFLALFASWRKDRFWFRPEAGLGTQRLCGEDSCETKPKGGRR